MRLCDFVTGVSVVTESSTGPIKRFREMNVDHVGVYCWVSPGSLLSGTRLSYERRRAEACVDESAHHALVNRRRQR